MDRLVVYGGRPLSGNVRISGMKNAALPMMAATILAPGTSFLDNVPALRDISTMAHLLRIFGAKVHRDGHTLEIDTSSCDFPEAPYELVSTMRASFFVLGPLLARFGRAKVALPGGCAIGPRPVDRHLKGLRALGARIEMEGGYVIAEAERLRGGLVHFEVPSVGATENVLMAAVLAEGSTAIENAAKEPEISALADFLRRMGARISGDGTDRIEVEGVS
ncbi:MAG: UDP-N-acetylglucosamine 1-carboxyvinyltransferase, partial [Candidatus Latescibacterota bacterium]